MPVTVGPLTHFRNIERQLLGEQFVTDTHFYKDYKQVVVVVEDDVEQAVVNYDC